MHGHITQTVEPMHLTLSHSLSKEQQGRRRPHLWLAARGCRQNLLRVVDTSPTNPRREAFGLPGTRFPGPAAVGTDAAQPPRYRVPPLAGRSVPGRARAASGRPGTALPQKHRCVYCTSLRAGAPKRDFPSLSLKATTTTTPKLHPFAHSIVAAVQGSLPTVLRTGTSSRLAAIDGAALCLLSASYSFPCVAGLPKTSDYTSPNLRAAHHQTRRCTTWTWSLFPTQPHSQTIHPPLFSLTHASPPPLLSLFSSQLGPWSSTHLAFVVSRNPCALVSSLVCPQSTPSSGTFSRKHPFASS